jgi:hypothetical protein
MEIMPRDNQCRIDQESVEYKTVTKKNRKKKLERKESLEKARAGHLDRLREMEKKKYNEYHGSKRK